jgi:hypothetical protein
MDFLIVTILIVIGVIILGSKWSDGSSEPAMFKMFAIVLGIGIFAIFGIGYYLGGKEPEKQCEVSFTLPDGNFGKTMIGCSQLKK